MQLIYSAPFLLVIIEVKTDNGVYRTQAANFHRGRDLEPGMFTKLWVDWWGGACFLSVYGKCRIPRSLLVILAGVHGVWKTVVSIERDEAAESVPPHRGVRWCQAKRFELFLIVGESWKFDEDFYFWAKILFYFFETCNFIF